MKGVPLAYARRLVVLLPVCACLAWSAPAHAQHGATGGEWPTYGGDLGSTKYSPLDQIDAANFDDLEIAWRWQSADGALDLDALREKQPTVSPRNFKATPLMVGGVLYTTTAMHQVAAIDAGTGETLWVHDPRAYLGNPSPHGNVGLAFNSRGLAYWTDGDDARVLWGTNEAFPARRRRPDGGADPDVRRQRPRGPDGRHPARRAGHDRLPGQCLDRRRLAAHRGARRGGHADGDLRLPPDEGGPARLGEGRRRADRRRAVDVPHRAPGGRLRRRHVAERVVALLGQLQRLVDS